MMGRVSLWADSGPGVGLGHVARCCAVASALQGLGVEGSLLTPALDGERFAGDQGIAAAQAQRIAAIADQGFRLAIVDSYRVERSHTDRLRENGVFVVVFDDRAEDTLPADVIVNGAPGAEPSLYDRHERTTYLLGPKYFPLRAPFAGGPAKAVSESVERVVVTVGGEDVHGLLLSFVKIAGEVWAGAGVIGVVGSAPYGGIVPPGCDVRRAPGDYPALVRRADVIVCGGGQSLMEAAAVGTPAAAVLLGDDQQRQRAAVIAAGAAVDGGDWRLEADVRSAKLRVALETMRPAPVRAQMSARGRALVDGAGAQRIARAIIDAWHQA